MTNVGAFAVFVAGMLIGAVLCGVTVVSHNRYAMWLGRECWVRPVGGLKWSRHVVVAVSWRGAVCVRRVDRIDKDGYWIKKQNVPSRVAFRYPGE